LFSNPIPPFFPLSTHRAISPRFKTFWVAVPPFFFLFLFFKPKKFLFLPPFFLPRKKKHHPFPSQTLCPHPTPPVLGGLFDISSPLAWFFPLLTFFPQPHFPFFSVLKNRFFFGFLAFFFSLPQEKETPSLLFLISVVLRWMSYDEWFLTQPVYRAPFFPETFFLLTLKQEWTSFITSPPPCVFTHSLGFFFDFAFCQVNTSLLFLGKKGKLRFAQNERLFRLGFSPPLLNQRVFVQRFFFSPPPIVSLQCWSTFFFFFVLRMGVGFLV